MQTICPNRIALCIGKHGMCFPEVEALAPMLKKSATELKPKQKYFR